MQCNSYIAPFGGACILSAAVGFSVVGSLVLGTAITFYLYREDKLRKIKMEAILESGLKKVISGKDEELTPEEKKAVDEDFKRVQNLLSDTDKLILELKKEKHVSNN